MAAALPPDGLHALIDEREQFWSEHQRATTLDSSRKKVSQSFVEKLGVVSDDQELRAPCTKHCEVMKYRHCSRSNERRLLCTQREDLVLACNKPHKVLVPSTVGQGDGSVLFVFGNESEKQQQTPDKQPSESTSAPSAQAAAPVQQDPTPPPATASQSTPQTSSSKPPAHAKAAAPETSEEPEATAFVSVAAGGPESNGKNAPSAGEAVEIDLASLKVGTASIYLALPLSGR